MADNYGSCLKPSKLGGGGGVILCVGAFLVPRDVEKVPPFGPFHLVSRGYGTNSFCLCAVCVFQGMRRVRFHFTGVAMTTRTKTMKKMKRIEMMSFWSGSRLPPSMKSICQQNLPKSRLLSGTRKMVVCQSRPLW